MAPFNSPGRGPKGSGRKTPAHPPKLDVSRLEDRDVPASTFSGTVFLDTNANGRFDAIPTLVNNPGAGLTPLTTEVGWNGLNQPWDPVGTRVPVTVRAFDSANTLQGTATTDLTGAYTLTVAAAGAYRLEFSNLPNGVSFGPSGQQTGTAVQTATVPANGNTPNLNLGLVRFEDITPDNPLIATNIYLFGAFDGPNANGITVTSFPYNSGANIPVPTPPGAPSAGTAGPFIEPTSHTIQITQNQVGATWGLAYDRATDRIFMSAFTKNHVGYGPSGPGAIYTAGATPTGANTSVTTASLLVDLGPTAAGTNYRTQAAFTNPTNTGGAGVDPYLRDGLYNQTVGGKTSQVGWDAVGKTGLGGLATDATGRFLFTVGLGDRKLYAVDTQNPTASPLVVSLPSVTGLNGFTGTSVGDPLGDLRPFSVSYYRGSIYVGAVNTAESTTLGGTIVGDRTALRAYVFQFKLNLDAAGNPTGTGQFVDLNGVATTSQAVLVVPLNYGRGYIQPGIADSSQTVSPISANWLPWSPVYRNITNANIPNIGFYPQPWLTGLSFDTDGNITLGLRDRAGDQFGALTAADPANPQNLYVGITGGDTLRAFTNQQSVGGAVVSRWTLENNGSGPGGTASSTGVGNGQGPGGGEFYAGDFLVPGINPNFQDHQEVSAGGVLQLPGYQDVAVTTFDPAQVSQRYNAGGVRWFRNTQDALNNRAGDAVRGYELYATGPLDVNTPRSTFAKANGVGDLVAIRTAPMEIGNKVFADLNRDGRQDPTDPGLAGVLVTLFKNGVSIGATTTDANGNYYFSSAADPGVANRVPGKAYGINVLPNMAYEVRIPLAQDALKSLTLTTAKINGGTEPQRDSDAVAVGTDGVVALTTGQLGTNVHTFDAGLIYRLSLGDFVWNDANNNGVFDTGEAAIPNVTVQLLDAANNVLSSAVTNAQGGYLFTDLNPGQYRVRIPLASAINPGLQGFISSTGTNASATGQYEPANGVPVQQANNADNGVTQAGNVNGSLVNVQPGLAPLDEPNAPNFNLGLTDNATNENSFRNQDFSFYQPLSIGDTVFVDQNNDGMRAGDPGLAGVTVQLLQITGGTGGIASTVTVGSTVTNANGGYLFTNLAAGTYRVRLVRDAGLNGYASSTGTPGSATGPFEPAVANPANDKDHGTQSAGFIDGPTLAYAPGAATAVDPTTIPAGLPADPAPLASQYRDQDFGVFQPLNLGDLVFEDANNNGVRDAGEPGVAGILVELLDAVGNPVRDAANNPISALTAADGTYLFTNLVPGAYRIRINPPAGYMSSTGVNGSPLGQYEPGLPGTDTTNNADHGTMVPNTQQIASSPVTLFAPLDPRNPSANTAGLANSANLAQDFGIYRKVSLGDFVWNDANNNGIFDAGETPIAGVTVRLLDGSNQPVLGANGQPITTVTAADGGYLFANLVAGTYRIEVVIPTGFVSSTGTNGSAAGPFEPVTTPLNPDNNRDHGTTQAGGTTVRGPLINAQPGLAPTNDTDGPASATAADAGTLNSSSYRDQDFGFFRPLAVGDLVWADANNNGLHDPGEPGIANVRVVLLGSDGSTVATTTTDANGAYRFSNLVPAVYSVAIAPPAGLTSSTGGTGSPYEPASQNNINDADKGTTQPDGSIRTLPFTLTAAGNPDEVGTANLRQDFGLFAPVPPPATLAVGDFVWFDANNNGTFDAGEVGAANVVVRLLNQAGATVATQTTNANGGYLFTGLSAGVYAVEIAPPAGFQSSTGGPGSPFEPAAQTAINNTDKGTGQPNGTIRTLPFTLLATGNPDANGTANLREDFGLFSPPVPPGVPPANISGTVYLDSNVNGTRDPGERPIPGTTVYLNGRDDSGNVVARTAVTDVNGNYRFDNLAPGSYTVREQQPDGKLYNGSTNVGTVSGTVTGTGGNDIISTVRLNAGASGINYNFGEIPTAATFGYVWVDANRNGVFDPTETPIPGVTVTIGGTAFPGTAFARPLTAADVPGGLTVVTNSVGRYDFPTLPFGTYTLTETQPVAYDDWQLQDGDPNNPRPTMAPNVFSNLSLTASAPIRGPFNFGEVLSSTTVVPPLSPETSKRQFLASTTGTGGTSPVTSTTTQAVPTSPGVVAPVTLLPLQPQFTAGTNPNNPAIIATGAGPGSSPLVRVFDYATGLEKFRFLAYEQGYTGGVRTAVGDVNGDGIPDIIVATGLGGGPRIRVFSGVDGTVLQDFFAYEPTYTGGLSVAAGDVNGDGVADIITGTDMGGGPRVRVFDGKTGAVAQDFFAFDSGQRGGVRVAAADINKDGRADIIAATGAGVPTRVRVFDGATQATLQDFAPFGDAFNGGAFVAGGDYNGDGKQDIIVGADAGGGPRVSVFDGLTATSVASFFAFEPTFTGGVRVAAFDINGTGKSAIVTAAGIGGGSRVTVYSGPGIAVVDDFFAYDATQNGGVYVGAGSAARKASASTGAPVITGTLGKPGTLPALPA